MPSDLVEVWCDSWVVTEEFDVLRGWMKFPKADLFLILNHTNVLSLIVDGGNERLVFPVGLLSVMYDVTSVLMKVTLLYSSIMISFSSNFSSFIVLPMIYCLITCVIIFSFLWVEGY